LTCIQGAYGRTRPKKHEYSSNHFTPTRTLIKVIVWDTDYSVGKIYAYM
jgi:hypothetical protein